MDTEKRLMMLNMCHICQDRPHEKVIGKVQWCLQCLDAATKKKPDRYSPKIGRNEKCPCGSGLKHKKCCGKNK